MPFFEKKDMRQGGQRAQEPPCAGSVLLGAPQEDSCKCPGLPSTPPVPEGLHRASVRQLYNLELVI